MTDVAAPRGPDDDPREIAHRGFAGVAPENTVVAAVATADGSDGSSGDPAGVGEGPSASADRRPTDDATPPWGPFGAAGVDGLVADYSGLLARR